MVAAADQRRCFLRDQVMAIAATAPSALAAFADRLEKAASSDATGDERSPWDILAARLALMSLSDIMLAQTTGEDES
jgi:hypothetical protein